MEADRIKQIEAALAQPLNPAAIHPPAPGKYGDYIKAHHAIREANRIFGAMGWNYEIQDVRQTNSGVAATQKGPQFRVGYMARVKVLVGPCTHEDVGHGQGFAKEGAEGDAHDSAVKEAVTDALKRALSRFGDPLGLALYDETRAHVGVPVDQNAVDAAVEAISSQTSVADLTTYWKRLRQNQPEVAQHADVIEAGKVRKAEIESQSPPSGAFDDTEAN